MSLATRCPACGTVFRVVPDQLKVSDGWVRCGRCTEVFDASQRLFDLEQGDAAASSTRPAPARPHDDAAAAMQIAARVSSDPAPPGEAAGEAAVDALTAPAQPADDRPVDAMASAAPVASAPEAATTDAAPTASADAPSPGFVRRADRAARWRQPGRRASLAVLSLLLALLLAGQMALHYRDHLAAASPATRPVLQTACRLLGCRVEPPRRIEALHVDSSGLLRVQDSVLYRLSLVVQNKAATPVRMPAIDLALTDAQGQTMVRRVLSAAELGQTGDSLAPGGEAALQATLDLGERQVAGYTVELFYP
jgi:predicted Zn finger-like uncharacterized protein